MIITRSSLNHTILARILKRILSESNLEKLKRSKKKKKNQTGNGKKKKPKPNVYVKDVEIMQNGLK